MTRTKQISYYIILILIFILGIWLRTNLFLTKDVFEDDECRLAITMLDKNFWQMFLPLGDAQSAPPIFMLVSKFIANISGYNEKALTLIPFMAGIASFFVFYKLCISYFTNRLPVLFCLFIFSVNRNLIFYSNTFKQYSTDVLVSILCLYFMPRIDFNNLNLKQLAIIGLAFIILPFVSLPSLFFIAGIIILNLIKNIKNIDVLKKFMLISIPLILTLLAYYTFNLAPSKMNLDTIFPDYWNDGFMSFSIKDFIRLITINIKFYFYPNSLSLCTFILLVWGSILCALDKSKVRKTSQYMLIITSLVLFASLIHVYPFCSRVGLYMLSIFILFVLKPLDRQNINSPQFWIAFLLVILSIYQFNIAYLTSEADEKNIVTYSPKKLMLELKEKFNPEKDIILINSASSASYLFYSSKYNFYTNKVYEIPTNKDDKILIYLNRLNNSRKYWLYLIKDYSQARIFPHIIPWVETKQILYLLKERNSYLIYFQIQESK